LIGGQTFPGDLLSISIRGYSATDQCGSVTRIDAPVRQVSIGKEAGFRSEKPKYFSLLREGRRATATQILVLRDTCSVNFITQ
jgi:hypothetical protein